MLIRAYVSARRVDDAIAFVHRMSHHDDDADGKRSVSAYVHSLPLIYHLRSLASSPSLMHHMLIYICHHLSRSSHHLSTYILFPCSRGLPAPDAHSLALVMDGLGKQGRWEACLSFVERLKEGMLRRGKKGKGSKGYHRAAASEAAMVYKTAIGKGS